MRTYFLTHFPPKVQPVSLTGVFFEGEGIIHCLYDVIQGVSGVGDIVRRGLGSLFMVEQLGWKLDVSGRMDLVADIDTDAERETRSNILGMQFHLLYFSWIILLHLNPEMRRFAYYVIRRYDCEVTLCSSPLGEDRIASSKLISVGFGTLLDWLTWWLRPRWWAPYPVEGLGVSDMTYINWIDTGFSVMPLGEAWGSYPGGRSWGPGSRESSCQPPLGRGMIEDLLIHHSFARVNFSWA